MVTVLPGQFWVVELARQGNLPIAEVVSVWPDGSVELRIQMGTDLTPWNTRWRLSPNERGQLKRMVWPQELAAVGGLPAHHPALSAPAAAGPPIAMGVPSEGQRRGPVPATHPVPVPPPPPVPQRRTIEAHFEDAIRQALQTGHPSHWRRAWGLFMHDPEANVRGRYEAPFLLWKLERLERAGKQCSEAAESTRRRLSELGYEGCHPESPAGPPPAEPPVMAGAPPVVGPVLPAALPDRPPVVRGSTLFPSPAPPPPREISRAENEARSACIDTVVRALRRNGLTAREAKMKVESVLQRDPGLACSVEALIQAVYMADPLPPSSAVIPAGPPPVVPAIPPAVEPRPAAAPPPPPPPPPRATGQEAEIQRELAGDFPQLTGAPPPVRPVAPPPARSRRRPAAPPPPPQAAPPPPQAAPPPPEVVRPVPPPPPRPRPTPPRPARPLPPPPPTAFYLEAISSDPMRYMHAEGPWSTGRRYEERESDKSLHAVPAPSDPVVDVSRALPPAEDFTWRGQILGYLLDVPQATFARIAADLAGVSSSTALFSPLDVDLWDMVADGIVEHTTAAPVVFRLTEEGRQFAEIEAEPRALAVMLGGPSAPAPEIMPAVSPAAEGDRPAPGERWVVQQGGVAYPVHVDDVDDNPFGPEGGVYTVRALYGGVPSGEPEQLLLHSFVSRFAENPRYRRRRWWS